MFKKPPFFLLDQSLEKAAHLLIWAGILLCLLVELNAGFLGQIGILTVVFFALDIGQAASGSHAAHTVFRTAALTVIPQGNTTRGAVEKWSMSVLIMFLVWTFWILYKKK